MKVSDQTRVTHRRAIELDRTEEFSVKPPTGWRNWTISLIDVYPTYFSLFGGPGRNKRGACLKIAYGYRSAGEVPTMPEYIANIVREAMKDMKVKEQEGREIASA